MRFWTIAPMLAAAFTAMGYTARSASADPALRISGPLVHENLAIYFLHGVSAPGSVPLTLQEALAKGSVQVIETGQVNELQIENSGGEDVFIQAGDIVKGGKQDRVLTVSFVLPPKSGKVPIASFCVEQGRWSARGKEDHGKFASAKEAMPSVPGLLAMLAPTPSKAEPSPTTGSTPDATRQMVQGGSETGEKQRKVWDSVAATQKKLSGGLNDQVAAPQSATSLQLSLENEKLKEARTAYIKSLEAAGLAEGDIVGYVVAINGKMSTANLYPSNGLFKKMWPKQLAASVTEAIGERQDGKPAEAPKPAAVSEFLDQAEQGKKQEKTTATGSRVETRDTDKALFNEARTAAGAWVHRNYLAK